MDKPPPKRPRIALVVHDCSEGFGQGRYCVELIRHLAPEFEFTVVSASMDRQALEGTYWVQVPAFRRSALSTVFSFRHTVARLLPAVGCDLVHSQGMTGGKPDLVTAHVCNPARCEAEGGGSFRGHLFSRLVAPFERAFYSQRSVRGVIAISKLVGVEVRRHYGWQGFMPIIHHGTDTTKFRPPVAGEREELRSQLGFRAEDWVWLFVGEADKGLREIVLQLPEFPTARLMVVSRSDLTCYRGLADRLSVRSRVTFHGPDSRPERIHRMADVFVYPSRYDTFALVVTEAMSSGLPVVVGQNVGAAELVIDGLNGLLCDPCSAESIRSALTRLQADRSNAREIGSAARKTIARYTWADCAQATARVYRELLNGKARPDDGE